jgi:hypothetical protein
MRRPASAFALAAWLLLAAGWAPPVRASFEAERPGARSAGMAGAFSAVADDADALLVNPAGLALVSLSTLSLGYGRLLTGLDDGTLGENRIAYLQPMAELGGGGLAWRRHGLVDVYTEDTFTLGCGFWLDAQKKLLAGAAVKLLRVAYQDPDSLAGNDYFNSGAAAAGFAADAGLLARVGEGFTAGLSLANLGQPDLSLQHGGAVVPWQVRGGLAYTNDDWLAAADYLRRANEQRIAAGGEAWWFQRLLGTRAGLALADGATEITAGLSAAWLLSDWRLQLDYAFLAPLGAFSGAGSSHLLNLTCRFGSLQPKSAKGLQLKADGERLMAQGRLQDAAEAWEQAADLLPDDEELAKKLDELRAELNRRSEIELYLKEGRTFQKAANYGSAADAYRKVLALDPQHPQATAELRAMLDKLTLQATTPSPSLARPAEEQAAAAQAKLARQRAADEALDAARGDLEQARQQPELRRYSEKEFKRLEKLLASAETWRQDDENERAQVAAQAVSAGVERLRRRAAQAAAKPESTPRVRVREAPAAAPAPVAQDVRPSQDTLRRKARGAYGRAIKLMLDIDRLEGRRWFPEDYAALQSALARVKDLLNSGNFGDAIRNAEALYPRLETLQTQSENKNKPPAEVPTNW